MNATEKAYIAGVLDADGYFTIRRMTYGVRVLKNSKHPTYAERVGIKQCKPEAINLIDKHYGGSRTIEKPSAENGKPLHSLQLTHLKANKLIVDILPYLRIKKKQARILIRLRASIAKGKQAKGEWMMQKSRWGTMMRTRKSRVSAKQIAYREKLIKDICNLNDTREFQKRKTKAWQ